MNRDRYILKRNEYDLLMTIEANTGICPIRAVAGITREEKIERCCTFVHEGCEVCVQSWLNEGGRKMNYKGKWYSESEIKALLSKLEAESEELKQENTVVLRETDRLIKEKGKLIAENYEAKKLLRESLPILRGAIFVNYKDTNAANELYDRIIKAVGGSENDT